MKEALKGRECTLPDEVAKWIFDIAMGAPDGQLTLFAIAVRRDVPQGSDTWLVRELVSPAPGLAEFREHVCAAAHVDEGMIPCSNR